MSEKQHRWDRHFLDLAFAHAKMSKDPSTKVGAVIVGPDLELRSAGFNGFPRGIADTAERLEDREIKLSFIVHAEMNAILSAARVGTPLKGCSMYIMATGADGSIWGGPPCVRCTVEALQAGITGFISIRRKAVPSRWDKSLFLSENLLREAGAVYREVLY
jgi:dCMP deaminase